MVNQKVNLGQSPMPTRLDFTILKDGFFEKPVKYIIIKAHIVTARKQFIPFILFSWH